MKKYVLGILFCSCLLGTGIGCSEKAREEKIPEAGKNSQNEITIMHVGGKRPGSENPYCFLSGECR